MNASIEERVSNAAEVELPVHQFQREVSVAESFVEHHLRHIDRPPFGEDTGAEGGAKRARRLIGGGELQVVPRDRLMDREQRQHAVVVFAHLRLNLFGRCIVGGGRHVEETLLAAVKRARCVKEGASVGAQEERRPHDLERLFWQINETRSADERFASRGLCTRSVQHLFGGAVITTDGVQHLSDKC